MACFDLGLAGSLGFLSSVLSAASTPGLRGRCGTDGYRVSGLVHPPQRRFAAPTWTDEKYNESGDFFSSVNKSKSLISMGLTVGCFS